MNAVRLAKIMGHKKIDMLNIYFNEKIGDVVSDVRAHEKLKNSELDGTLQSILKATDLSADELIRQLLAVQQASLPEQQSSAH